MVRSNLDPAVSATAKRGGRPCQKGHSTTHRIGSRRRSGPACFREPWSAPRRGRSEGASGPRTSPARSASFGDQRGAALERRGPFADHDAAQPAAHPSSVGKGRKVASVDVGPTSGSVSTETWSRCPWILALSRLQPLATVHCTRRSLPKGKATRRPHGRPAVCKDGWCARERHGWNKPSASAVKTWVPRTWTVESKVTLFIGLRKRPSGLWHMVGGGMADVRILRVFSRRHQRPLGRGHRCGVRANAVAWTNRCCCDASTAGSDGRCTGRSHHARPATTPQGELGRLLQADARLSGVAHSRRNGPSSTIRARCQRCTSATTLSPNRFVAASTVPMRSSLTRPADKRPSMRGSSAKKGRAPGHPSRRQERHRSTARKGAGASSPGPLRRGSTGGVRPRVGSRPPQRPRHWRRHLVRGCSDLAPRRAGHRMERSPRRVGTRTGDLAPVANAPIHTA